MQKKGKIWQKVCFFALKVWIEIMHTGKRALLAPFLRPVGAALNSRGRKPTEVITPYPLCTPFLLFII